MPSPLAELLGALTIAIILLDVYLTVLYARSRTGFVARFVIRGGWNLMRSVSRWYPTIPTPCCTTSASREPATPWPV